MAQLERYLHDQPSRTPTLLKAALAHVQFETIHPFLDGNGRVGRLLIPMLLCVEGVLREPLLYLSLYFKQNRSQYYEKLDRVRTEGEWEEWVMFFATGVEETANAAVATAQRMNEMAQADRARVQGAGRIAGSALQVHHALLSRPINTIARLATDTKLSVPTVTGALAALTDLELVREITGRKRGRVFAYGPYLDVLQQGMEPL
jgi:Fic family protein